MYFSFLMYSVIISFIHINGTEVCFVTKLIHVHEAMNHLYYGLQSIWRTCFQVQMFMETDASWTNYEKCAAGCAFYS